MNVLEQFKSKVEKNIFTTSLADVRNNNLGQAMIKIVRPTGTYFPLGLKLFLSQVEKGQITIQSEDEATMTINFIYTMKASDPFAV